MVYQFNVGVSVEDDVTIAAYELAGACANAPALLWGHANGFSGGSYLPLLQRLARGGFRVFAYDARGQGGSTTPPEPYGETITFDRFAHDMERVVGAIRRRAPNNPLYFAGHSFSAATRGDEKTLESALKRREEVSVPVNGRPK